MKILLASSEAVPYVKTGGLADVVCSIRKELRKMKHEARIILPLYNQVRQNARGLRDTGRSFEVHMGGRTVRGGIYTDEEENLFIECPEFFNRPEIYGTAAGDYADNASRFAFFSRGILETCKAVQFRPDIIHCNDWQTGLVPLYLLQIYAVDDFFRDVRTLLTIHNMGYQGLFPASIMPLTGFGWEIFSPEGIEFYGKVNFLKAGLISADVITTVSTTYAKQILTKDYGYGLDGLLKSRKNDLFGIINGIDYEEWNPGSDPLIAGNYRRERLQGKAVCKKDLITSLFPTAPARMARMPVIGIVGRLSEQKGFDLIMDAAPEIVSQGAKLVILGKGDEYYERNLLNLKNKFPDSLSVTVGFDEGAAHKVYAGSDFFLMPSRYEPCGLGQLIAQRYGSIPIGRKTGGIADSVYDFEPLKSKGTGFLFSDYTSSALRESVKRAFCLYTDGDKMKKVIDSGMRMDFSWKGSALRYLEIYRAAAGKKRLRGIS